MAFRPRTLSRAAASRAAPSGGAAVAIAALLGAAVIITAAPTARADIVSPEETLPDAVVGSCWTSSPYFSNGTMTRLCIVSPWLATYEGRVADAPDFLCRGKADLGLWDGVLSIYERAAECTTSSWTPETFECHWDEARALAGGPIPCTVDEPNFGRAKLSFTRE